MSETELALLTVGDLIAMAKAEKQKANEREEARTALGEEIHRLQDEYYILTEESKKYREMTELEKQLRELIEKNV
tara:strand:- start:2242 stop:2466 length:225 start_codon:yes stop_codon:yes gene_type:complete